MLPVTCALIGQIHFKSRIVSHLMLKGCVFFWKSRVGLHGMNDEVFSANMCGPLVVCWYVFLMYSPREASMKPDNEIIFQTSWTSKGPHPPDATPRRNRALLRDYFRYSPPSSPNKALLRPAISLGGVAFSWIYIYIYIFEFFAGCKCAT